jgi:hypothetical protein
VKYLLGCDAKTVRCDLKSLCEKPKIKGAVVCDDKIYVFRGGKYWAFDDKHQKNKPFGDLIAGPLPALDKWKDIKLPSAMGCKDGNLVVIVNNKWSEWGPDGKVIIADQSIGKGNGTDDDLGALVLVNEAECRFAKVMDNKVCYYVMKYDRLYTKGECAPVGKDENNFPPDIVAAVKTNDDMWYFFNKKGEYCQRRTGDFNEVCVFGDDFWLSFALIVTFFWRILVQEMAEKCGRVWL